MSNHVHTNHDNILQRIAEKTRQRIEYERTLISDEALIEQAHGRANEELSQGPFTFPFEQALTQSGTSFICEVKKHPLLREL